MQRKTKKKLHLERRGKMTVASAVPQKFFPTNLFLRLAVSYAFLFFLGEIMAFGCCQSETFVGKKEREKRWEFQCRKWEGGGKKR